MAVSAAGLGLTALIELVAAVLSGSVGLLGDVLAQPDGHGHICGRLRRVPTVARPATAAHAYGWERAEDLAGLGVAAVIWASAVFAGIVSVHKLTKHGRNKLPPH